MLIVIHREKIKDAERAFEDVLQMLKITKCSGDIKLCPTKHKSIYIDDVAIEFMSGDLNKMMGIRANYFNTDTFEAEDFLSLQSSVVKGELLDNLALVVAVVTRHIEIKRLKGFSKKEEK